MRIALPVFLSLCLTIFGRGDESPTKIADGVLFNGWGLSPAGKPTELGGDMPLKMVVAPDGKAAIAICSGYNTPGLAIISLPDQKLTQYLPVTHSFNGLCFDATGNFLFVSGGAESAIHVFNYANGEVNPFRSIPVKHEGKPMFLAGMARHPVTGKLYVCNEANHEVCVLNEQTYELETTIPVGLHPHSCIFGADHRHLYVSNWGSRSVSVVDTETNRHLRDLSVGVRPNDIALSNDGRLFVACSGDNTVHVIQTRTLEQVPVSPDSSRRLWEGTREILSTSLYPQSPEGSTPDAVATSPDGRTLFVANADNNCVMVVNISGEGAAKDKDDDDDDDDKDKERDHAKVAEHAPAKAAKDDDDDKDKDKDKEREPAKVTAQATSKPKKKGKKAAPVEKVSVVEGFIPVGWYPTALAVSPDNNTLLVGNGKGVSAALNPSKSPEPPTASGKPKAIHPARFLKGSVSFVSRPDNQQMAAYTAQTRKNSPYTPESLHRTATHSASVIPERVGDACPIKHVLYIIKENRTYDQVFGDMKDAAGSPIGNGDSSITMYGEAVTPNQHSAAREYVLLDNLYCNGEVSVDGHSWCDAAIATDFNERSWILSYSSRKDHLAGNDEMETPTAGYLWDACRRAGLSFKNYGEGAQRVPTVNRGKWTGTRDIEKVNGWISDLHKAEKTGELPRFTIMSLGEDHTAGTTPGKFKPEACVASNDIALGRIIEAATKSPFWKEMAIFVIEDDAQNGPDHVDAHRTTGLVISPYVKRHTVDSTVYTTASMVRTMELILGLPPMTQYDGAATPMFNAFSNEPVLTPFEVQQPTVDILATNTSKSPGAKKSAMMNFKEYDLAPEDELNRILWAAAKGETTPYPTPIHRVLFTKE